MTDPVHCVAFISKPGCLTCQTYFWLHLVKIAGNIICNPPDDTIKTWDEYCLVSHANQQLFEWLDATTCRVDQKAPQPLLLSQLEGNPCAEILYRVCIRKDENLIQNYRIWLMNRSYEYINTSKCTCWEVLGKSGVVLVAFMLSKHHIRIMDCLQDLFIRNTEFSEFQQGCRWAPQEATVN